VRCRERLARVDFEVLNARRAEHWRGQIRKQVAAVVHVEPLGHPGQRARCGAAVERQAMQGAQLVQERSLRPHRDQQPDLPELPRPSGGKQVDQRHPTEAVALDDRVLVAGRYPCPEEITQTVTVRLVV
jgi:hypothetical protein